MEENITVKKWKDLGEKWKLNADMEMLEWCVTGNLFQDDDMEPLSGLSFEFGISVFLGYNQNNTNTCILPCLDVWAKSKC